jgi:radical SAM superfamily enzyme YgiQ (UPF0313 family)
MRILLIVYDNGTFTHGFPMGLGYIAAVLEKASHDVEIYAQDFHHYPNDHLTGYLDNNHFDAIGVSLIAGYYQYRKLLALSKAINGSKDRPIYIIGGYGPTPEPEFFLKKTQADVVVMGEGEDTVVELMAAIANKSSFKSIPGIAYREGDKVYINDRRPLTQNVSEITWPAYHLFPMHYYRMFRMPYAEYSDFVMPVMSGRGCTFKCTFCYRMDTGYRERDVGEIIEEIRFLNKEYGINYISFQDDLLMTSVVRTQEISDAILSSGMKIKWACNGRLNYCTTDLLKLMKDSGCVFVNYGIESMDNEVLKNMKKGLRVDQVIRGIEMTLKTGISPGLNIIFGNIGDTRETLEKSVDFLLKYDDFVRIRTIRPVTPYPGSPLYADAINKGLLEGPEDFYERKHLNSDLVSVNFTEMSDDELYECLKWANGKLLSNYYTNVHDQALSCVRELYDSRDPTFRGFRYEEQM